MPIPSFVLPLNPAGGAGATVNVSSMDRVKALTLTGAPFTGRIIIEGSANGVNFAPVAVLQAEGPPSPIYTQIEIPCNYLRTNWTLGPVTPIVSCSAEPPINPPLLPTLYPFVTLPIVPNGLGAPVDVSALDRIKGVYIDGTFGGPLELLASTDGVTYVSILIITDGSNQSTIIEEPFNFFRVQWSQSTGAPIVTAVGQVPALIQPSTTAPLSRAFFVDGTTPVPALQQDGSINRPFATIGQANAAIGDATTPAQYADPTQTRWEVYIWPGVYTESLAVPIRPEVVYDFTSGARLVGDLAVSGDYTGVQATAARVDVLGDGLDITIQGNVLVSGANGFGAMLVTIGLTGAFASGNVSNTSLALDIGLFCDGATSGFGGGFTVPSASGHGSLIATDATIGTLGTAIDHTRSPVMARLSGCRFVGPVFYGRAGAVTLLNTLFAAGSDFSGGTAVVNLDSVSDLSLRTNAVNLAGLTINLLDDAGGVAFSNAGLPSGSVPSVVPTTTMGALDALFGGEVINAEFTGRQLFLHGSGAPPITLASLSLGITRNWTVFLMLSGMQTGGGAHRTSILLVSRLDSDGAGNITVENNTVLYLSDSPGLGSSLAWVAAGLAANLVYNNVLPGGMDLVVRGMIIVGGP